MPENLNEAFAVDNLHRAWRWTLTNTDALYKNHFRRTYEAYAAADDKLLNHLRQKLRRDIYLNLSMLVRFTSRKILAFFARTRCYA